MSHVVPRSGRDLRDGPDEESLAMLDVQDAVEIQGRQTMTDGLRALNNQRETFRKRKKLYEKYFDVEDTSIIIKYGWAKVIVYLALMLASVKTAAYATDIKGCTGVTYSKVGTVCAQSNPVFNDTTVVCCAADNCSGISKTCGGVNLALEKSNSLGAVFHCFATVAEFSEVCVDSTSCPTISIQSVTSPLTLMSYANGFSLCLEIIIALLFGRFQEYSEDDFVQNDGYVLNCAVGTLKSGPTITTATHFGFGAAILWLGLEVYTQGVACV